MTEPTLKIEGVSIVIIGDFNPTIIQPLWLANQGLISQEAASPNIAKIGLIHRDITDFSIDWLRLNIERNKFVATTEEESNYDSLRDLVKGIFQILRHTPVKQIGFNRFFHYKMPSEETFNRYGDCLAPKNPWKDLIKTPGLLDLTMMGERPDSYKGYLQVRTCVSPKINPHGILIHVNDHFELEDTNSIQGCRELLEILENIWEPSLQRALPIATRLVNSA
ncbi:MAG: hypothetical protein H7832_03155 [Magnetococcus sp. DMHC-6]